MTPCTKPVQRFPISLQGEEIPVISVQKFLGVMVDQELWWKEQVKYALQKGTSGLHNTAGWQSCQREFLLSI